MIAQWKKILLLLWGGIILLPTVHAIAIIGPAAYVVTISLFAFIANTAIAATVFIAANVVLTKRVGQTALSTHIRFFLALFSKILVMGISIFLATLIMPPLTLQSTLLSGVCSALIAMSCAFLASYERFSIATASKRNVMLREIVLYGIFVFIAGSVIGYYAVETTPVVAHL